MPELLEKVAPAGTLITVPIAGVKLARSPDRLRTVLGSCVGIALLDIRLKVASLGHIMLPDSGSGEGDPGKFADTGVDLLVDTMIRAGCARERLCAKIAGGAAMFGSETTLAIGERNAEAVRARLKHHRISIAGEDIGGTKGRRMLVNPCSGEVTVEVIGAGTVTL